MALFVIDLRSKAMEYTESWKVEKDEKTWRKHGKFYISVAIRAENSSAHEVGIARVRQEACMGNIIDHSQHRIET